MGLYLMPIPVLDLHRLTLIHTDLKPENILLVNHDFKTVGVPPPPNSRVWLAITLYDQS